MIDFLERVAAQRQKNYRQTNAPAIHTLDKMHAFINEVGFCLLFAHKDIELPDLWSISEGRPWLWKDQLSTGRQVYYGKRFQGKAGFLSKEMLAAQYALTPTAEFGGDRFELYRHGFLSEAAHRLTGVVFAHGPLTSRELRRAVGLAGASQRSQYSKVLVEVEANFLVVNSGTTSTSYARYTYVWDSFARHWSEIAQLEPQLTHEEAGVKVMTQYIKTVVAATTAQIAAALSLHEDFVRYLASRMVAKGLLKSRTAARSIYYTLADMAI